MADVRVSKPRVGVNIWMWPVDILNVLNDVDAIGAALAVATEEELKKLRETIDLELNRRENNGQ